MILVYNLVINKNLAWNLGFQSSFSVSLWKGFNSHIEVFPFENGPQVIQMEEVHEDDFKNCL